MLDLKPGVCDLLARSDEWRVSADRLLGAGWRTHAAGAVVLYAHAVTGLLHAATQQAGVWPSATGARGLHQLVVMGALPEPGEDLRRALDDMDADLDRVLKGLKQGAAPTDPAAPEVDARAAQTAVLQLRALVDLAFNPPVPMPAGMDEANRLRREGPVAENDGLRSPAEIAALHIAAAEAAVGALTDGTGVELTGITGLARRWDFLEVQEVIRFAYPNAHDALTRFDALEHQVRRDGRNPSVQQLEAACADSRTVIGAVAEILTDRVRFAEQRAERAARAAKAAEAEAEVDDAPQPS